MKLLIAIGCNSYDYCSQLAGAERDAIQMYEALVNSRSPFYDRDKSILLLSPTIDNVRSALKSALFDGNRLDVLTFYFAGHGAVANSSFYMCTRDTQQGALSATAFALADMFRNLNEAKPAQTNIIIDACESGGLVEDLNVLLKGTLYGEAGTPGITLFAASASNEYAKETAFGGIATQAILARISGAAFLRDDSPTLDLLEIGRKVNDELKDAGQSPAMWGLNLYGPPQFCVNPRYSATDSDLRQALKLANDDGPHPAPNDISTLWRLHYTLPEKWDARAFLEALRTCLSAFGPDEVRRSVLARRYYQATCARIANSDEAMRKAEVGATLLATILPWLHEPSCAQLASDVQEEILTHCRTAAADISDQISKDRLCLLRHPGGGLPDLFYHPLRLSMLAGWLALPQFFATSATAGEEYGCLLQSLVEAYTNCFTVVCEEQAPGIAISICALSLHGRRDLAEELLGYYFSSLTDTGARIATDSSDGSAALEYMLARAANNFSLAPNSIAHPCETLGLILRLGQALGLDEAFDPYLWQLDGASGIFFMTTDWKEFGSEHIAQGQNLTFTIGREIFRIADLGKARTEGVPTSAIERFSIICTALVFPDRIPWFLVDEMLHAHEASAT